MYNLPLKFSKKCEENERDVFVELGTFVCSHLNVASENDDFVDSIEFNRMKWHYFSVVTLKHTH